jgi:hypothetical protein
LEFIHLTEDERFVCHFGIVLIILFSILIFVHTIGEVPRD